MTVTDVTTDQGREPVELPAADGQLLRELTERARAAAEADRRGADLLGKLTKMVAGGPGRRDGRSSRL